MSIALVILGLVVLAVLAGIAASMDWENKDKK